MSQITFTIKYALVLEVLTGTDLDTFTVDLGAEENVKVPFNFAMYSVDNAHPELFKKYPPGKLDFKLNGQDPEPTTPLKNGDIVYFGIC